jgi:hypothetical protein
VPDVASPFNPSIATPTASADEGISNANIDADGEIQAPRVCDFSVRARCNSL